MKKFIGFVILFIALVATTNTFAQCTGNKKATTSTEQGATQVMQTGDNTAKAGACQKTGAACCKNKTATAQTAVDAPAAPGAACCKNKTAQASTDQNGAATQIVQTGNTAKAGACQKTGAACCKNKTAQASTDKNGAATQIVQTSDAAKPACCKNPHPGCTSEKTTMSKKSKGKKAKTEKVILTSGSSKGVDELKNNDGTR